DELFSLFKAYSVALILHGLVWVFYPVHYALRPDLGSNPEGMLKLISLFYGLDTPAVNSFPSLHVTGAFLSFFIIRRHWAKGTPLLFLLAVLISLSTLTFKQHYMADVLAGMTVAYFLNLIFLERGSPA
ncbi:MAG: phosphatase PAP2 family protein, partial [Deltaproteobacteria bacterium]|nr:phosphatase PAP2 family protein [Deltaproteobacteria bacterium]